MRSFTAAATLAFALAAASPAAAQTTRYVPTDVRQEGGGRTCSFAGAPHIRLGSDFIVFSINATAPGRGGLRVYRRFFPGSADHLDDASVTIESPVFARTAVTAVRAGFDTRKPIVVTGLGHGQGDEDEPGKFPTFVTIDLAPSILQTLAQTSALTLSAVDASGRELAQAVLDVREFRHFAPIQALRPNGCT